MAGSVTLRPPSSDMPSPDPIDSSFILTPSASIFSVDRFRELRLDSKLAMNPDTFSKKISPRGWLAVSLLTFSSLSCGQIGLGGGDGVNEAAPSGTVMRSGTFETLEADSPVSGLVQVIISAGTGTNVVHLESFTAPDENDLELRAVVNGSDVRIATLRSNSGNMNYSSRYVGATPSWTLISIRSPSKDKVYGSAVLR